MPSRSHGRCKVCRAITHINSRFGLCAVHMRQHNKRIAEERKANKLRRAQRLVTVLEEGPAMTEFKQTDEAPVPGKIGRRPLVELTDDQRVEILDAYTKTDEPVGSINKRFGINDTYIYRVLDRVGVSWRRGNPESYEQWQANQRAKPAEETVPEPVTKALENMLKLPPRPEPVAPTPAVERRAQLSLPENVLHWQIKVQGVLDAYYPTIEEALASVRRLQPGVRITGITLVED